MLEKLSIAQLNQHVEVAYEQMAEPLALGGFTAEEVTELITDGLVLVMNELHARALLDNVDVIDTAEGFTAGGAPATFTVLPRTAEQIAFAAEVATLVKAAESARSVAPF